MREEAKNFPGAELMTEENNTDAKDLIKVLLIDDDEEDFMILEDIVSDISSSHMTLEWVSSFEEGLEAIKENAHDVYLIDYRLGAHTGLEIIEEASRQKCLCPMILLTGQGDVVVDFRAMQAGAVDYLIKGKFDGVQLERSIRYGIQHTQNLKEIRTLNLELEDRVESRTRKLADAISTLETANHNLEIQITETRLAEEQARESKDLYSAIAHQFPGGTISVVNRRLKFLLFDGSELAQFGREPKEWVGRNLLETLPEEKHEKFKENLQQAFSGKKLNFEEHIGGQFYNVNLVPLRNQQQEIRRVLIVNQNITEQKKAEEDIRNALDKERELSELKSRFVTMASHEFRTPLSTILSSATLIKKYQESALPEKMDKHINRIKSSVSNLTTILNDFLSLAKLEEGKVLLNVSSFNLRSLQEDVVDEMQAVLKEGQQIEFVFEGEDQMVSLDSNILKNVLINLLSNAIKYSLPEKTIAFRSAIEGEMVKFSIQDQGIGIPDTDKAHMFERFFRAKNASNIQGTGLGLNIVKKYIELLGGDISFTSELNVGTTFFVELPTHFDPK